MSKKLLQLHMASKVYREKKVQKWFIAIKMVQNTNYVPFVYAQFVIELDWKYIWGMRENIFFLNI